MLQVCKRLLLFVAVYIAMCHSRLRVGTIAGSSNLAADTTPSTLRNNGVAGAFTTGANARGARLFFQVRRPVNCAHDTFFTCLQDIQNKVTDAQCAAAGLSAKCKAAFLVAPSSMFFSSCDVVVEVVMG